jgi:hypothetical protein
MVPGRCGRRLRRCEQPERGSDDQGCESTAHVFKINSRSRVAWWREGPTQSVSPTQRPGDVPRGAHGSPVAGFADVIPHRALPASPHQQRSLLYRPLLGRDLATIWQQNWRYKPNAALVFVGEGGIVTALNWRVLSVAKTCFQYHEYGRRAGLKIRSSQEGAVQVPPSVLASVRTYVNVDAFAPVEVMSDSHRIRRPNLALPTRDQ